MFRTGSTGQLHPGAQTLDLTQAFGNPVRQGTGVAMIGARPQRTAPPSGLRGPTPSEVNPRWKVRNTCKLCLFRMSQQGERRRYRGTAFWTTEPSTQFGEGNIPKQLNSVIKVNFPCGKALSAATAIRSQCMPTIAQRRKQHLVSHGHCRIAYALAPEQSPA